MDRINDALDSRVFSETMAVWSEQRDFLRGVVAEFWTARSMLFQLWWNTAALEIREAMVLTCLEDLPQTTEGFETFGNVLTPELIQNDELFKDPSIMLLLMERAFNNEENSDAAFPNKKEMHDSLTMEAIDQPHVAGSSMLALRSVLILQFLSDITLLFDQQMQELASKQSG